MRKDKKWLKDLINEEGIVTDMHLLGRLDEQYWKNENIKINKGRLFYLIDQLDEPQKPVIPQFVAEWIKETKPYNSLRVAFEYIAQRKRDDYDDELALWVEDGNSETLAKAWLDGYEVEKEKKYFIKEPITGQFLIRDDSQSRGVKWVYGFSTSPSYFTEAEIKAIDKRYWVFAEEVTE